MNTIKLARDIQRICQEESETLTQWAGQVKDRMQEPIPDTDLTYDLYLMQRSIEEAVSNLQDAVKNAVSAEANCIRLGEGEE